MTTSKKNMDQFTALERAILEEYHKRYEAFGFPKVEDFEFLERTNTGAGRFTRLRHSRDMKIPDGSLSLGEYSQFDMQGLEAGATFGLEIVNGKVCELEIVINGNQEWNGVEDRWKILDPDTAENYIRQS